MHNNISNKQIYNWLFSLIKTAPRNLSYYLEALTHSSYANENKLNYNYNKLEFFGDSIINFLTSRYLFKKYVDKDEGFYTLIKIRLVQSKTLSHAAKMINLDKFLFLGQGAKMLENKDKILEDAFEALIAAIYLDLNDIEKCNQILKKTIFTFEKNDDLNDVIDYKSMISEIFSKNNINIMYKTNQLKDKKYQVFLIINNINYGSGMSSSIKEAEKLAAKSAFSKLINNK